MYIVFDSKVHNHLFLGLPNKKFYRRSNLKNESSRTVENLIFFFNFYRLKESVFYLV